MEELDWTRMVQYQQELHKLSRAMLVQQQKRALTSSERELLSWLYLKPDENTPLALSNHSGMKKEAVSRCLKGLFEKGCIQKAKHPKDERSYQLSLTEKGLQELRRDYEVILQPFYDLLRSMGADFETLFELIVKANEHTKKSFGGGK